METTKMITGIKLTGETVAVGMGVSVIPASVVPARLRGGVVPAGGLLLDGVLGLGGTGLSRDWASVDVRRVERSERPTQAPKAVAAAANHGYVHGFGAGTQQIDQQTTTTEAGFPADVIFSMRAFRGLEPWRERT